MPPNHQQIAAPAEAGPSSDLVQNLYAVHALTLVRMAKLLLRDQESAEDAVQDAFLGLCQALPRLKDPGNVLPYLRTAVLNQARSALRSRRTARRLLWDEAGQDRADEAAGQSAESAAIAGENRRAVLAAIGRLPQRAREVLVLRYYLDLPEAEIAATLGVSRGTVSSTASRALASLAADLQENR